MKGQTRDGIGADEASARIALTHSPHPSKKQAGAAPDYKKEATASGNIGGSGFLFIEEGKEIVLHS